MPSLKSLIALSALLATSLAAPADVQDTLETKVIPWDQVTASRESQSLSARANTAIVTAYNGDVCNGGNSGFTIVGGGDRCVPFTNVRSISVAGSGCTIRTWSGNNCRGSSAGIPYDRCVSVLYASVSVVC